MKACMRKEAWCIPLVCLWTCNSASNYLPYKLFVSLLHESNIAIVAITFEKESNHKQRHHPNESRFHNYLVHEISMLISALFNFSMMKQCSSKPYHRLSELVQDRRTDGQEKNLAILMSQLPATFICCFTKICPTTKENYYLLMIAKIPLASSQNPWMSSYLSSTIVWMSGMEVYGRKCGCREIKNLLGQTYLNVCHQRRQSSDCGLLHFIYPTLTKCIHICWDMYQIWNT